MGRGCPLPPGEGTGTEKFLILALNIVSFGAFWMVFFTVQLPVLHANRSSTAIYAYKSRDGE